MQQSYGLDNIFKKVWITHILIRTTWRRYTLFKIRRELVCKRLNYVMESPLSLLTAHCHYFKILVDQKLLCPLHMKLEITIEATWYWKSNQFCWQNNCWINLLCVVLGIMASLLKIVTWFMIGIPISHQNNKSNLFINLKWSSQKMNMMRDLYSPTTVISLSYHKTSQHQRGQQQWH